MFRMIDFRTAHGAGASYRWFRPLASFFFDNVRDESGCARDHENAVERCGIIPRSARMAPIAPSTSQLRAPPASARRSRRLRAQARTGMRCAGPWRGGDDLLPTSWRQRAPAFQPCDSSRIDSRIPAFERLQLALGPRSRRGARPWCWCTPWSCRRCTCTCRGRRRRRRWCWSWCSRGRRRRRRR